MGTVSFPCPAMARSLGEEEAPLFFAASTEGGMMSWTRRSAGLLVAAVMVMSVAACTAGGGGEGEASCANLYTYQDRSYLDVAPHVKFTLGNKLGSATQTPCDDTGGQDESEAEVRTENAYAIDGISPKVAIAIGDTPETAALFAVRSGDEVPSEVQKLIDGS
ncbi:DUF6281 family protein [Streptomyces sp. NPDC016469]|uniref:DUF6281 family protein n=1 Tax=Streptomyces sp. NPDC016469 TaxID=3157191 RepID=UPI0033C25537